MISSSTGDSEILTSGNLTLLVLSRYVEHYLEEWLCLVLVETGKAVVKSAKVSWKA